MKFYVFVDTETNYIVGKKDNVGFYEITFDFCFRCFVAVTKADYSALANGERVDGFSMLTNFKQQSAFVSGGKKI